MFKKSSVFVLILILAVLLSVCSCRETDISLPESSELPETELFSSDTFVVPKLSVSWSSATKLYDLPASGFSGDYTLFKDSSGRFHLIGMDNNSGSDRSFFVAGGKLSGKMSYETRLSYSGDVMNVWSPCVVYKEISKSYYLFYHYQTPSGGSQIRIMESKDSDMKTWKPLNIASLKDGCVAFEGDSARDPYVFYDSSAAKYLMYYTGNGIMLRTSTDLIKWSEPVTVLKSVDNFKYVDSPCVVKKNGRYFLFVGCSDFGRTAVFYSDKFDTFPAKNKLGEINGHCVKVFSDGSQDYILSSQINEANGTEYRKNSKGKYTLPGIYVQKLEWVSQSKAQWLKLGSSSTFDDNDLVFITDKADYHWSFDGNVNEEHGYGVSITPPSSAFADGLDGKCLNCTNSFYDTGIYDFRLGTEFTISFYMKMKDPQGQWNVIFSKGPKAEGHIEIYTSPDGVLAFYQAEIGIKDVGVNVADDRWHHCAFTYDGEYLKCYIDGAQVAVYNLPGVPSDNKEHPLAIGCLYENDSPIFYYHGLLDDLKIFNRVIDSVSYN